MPQYKAIIALNNINGLDVLMETECVLCEVETEFLRAVQMDAIL
jgi:hypothetical protein